ncbi:helix-turn-helix transcriptional regulator [Nocardia fusca]|uniref:Helix-turn-helix transcriptional regulator n=1 Tax=Nocardia fusca TaxID=941183 RepID=A0ABV3FGW6_9NOCA
MTEATDLAAFLRARRGELRPRDVGLPETARRRTPGLRRQEVALLAGISVEYYVRMEQARGPRPSAQVLGALARALMLTGDERDYLYRTAGHRTPETVGPNRVVSSAVRTVLDSMVPLPAYIVDAGYEVLAWNRCAVPFIGDLATMPGAERNMVRWIFRQAADDPRWDDAETLSFARSTVADLRATYARYPGNPSVTGLVTELLGTSPRFAQLWAAQDVAVRRTHRKQVPHPEFGVLDFECQVLDIPDTDQRIIVYCAAPGTSTGEAFRRIAEATERTAAR